MLPSTYQRGVQLSRRRQKVFVFWVIALPALAAGALVCAQLNRATQPGAPRQGRSDNHVSITPVKGVPNRTVARSLPREQPRRQRREVAEPRMAEVAREDQRPVEIAEKGGGRPAGETPVVSEIKRRIRENAPDPSSIEWIAFTELGRVAWLGSKGPWLNNAPAPGNYDAILAKWRCKNSVGALQVFSAACLVRDGEVKGSVWYPSQDLFPASDFDAKGVHKSLRELDNLELPNAKLNPAPAAKNGGFGGFDGFKAR